MAAQWPRVVTWLVATLPNLPGWSGVAVYDGPPTTGDNPVQYVTVGYVENDLAGTYSLTQDPGGFQWQETGEVRSQLVVNSGDSDLSGLRVTLFGLADALEANVRADRTLGGTLSLRSQVTFTGEVLSVTNQQGSAQAAVLTLRYFTVT